jgi:hypothetical protein
VKKQGCFKYKEAHKSSVNWMGDKKEAQNRQPRQFDSKFVCHEILGVWTLRERLEEPFRNAVRGGRKAYSVLRKSARKGS